MKGYPDEQASDYNLKEEEDETTISTLVNGNKKLEARVKELSKSENDPPLLFSWKSASLTTFWNKAVAYGNKGGNILPPPQICGGNHPVGPRTDQAIDDIKFGILMYLSSLALGSSVIGTGCWHCVLPVATHDCRCPPAGNGNNALVSKAVLVTGEQLPGPQASVFIASSKGCVGAMRSSSLWNVLHFMDVDIISLTSERICDDLERV